jgi:antitoxin CptB
VPKAAGLSKKWFFMQDDLDVRRRRAAYRASHRGTKEMDIVLGRYAQARLAAMSEAELEAFERFLALPDPLLTTWFANGDAAGDAGEFAVFVSALRSHHGLTSPEGGEGLDKR